MSDAIPNTRTGKLVLPGHRDNQVQWGGSGETWVQLEFESLKLFTRKEENNSGKQALTCQTSFIGSWDFGRVSLTDDSHLWGQLSAFGEESEERPQSFFGGQ